MSDDADDRLPTPGAFVRFLVGVALHLFARYLLVLFVLLIPVIIYCATR